MSRGKRVAEIKKETKAPAKKISAQPFEGYLDSVVSTGSTLLDLAISGGRVHGGGIPGGILMEIYGPSQTGKTAILSELCASAQLKGGKVKFLDPEARLDKAYSEIYGVEIDKKNYETPDTVTEVFDYIYKWKPPQKGDSVNVIATDSLAALSTDMELDEGDTMGMRRAKEFSAGLRKTCRLIKKMNWIVACTNQIRKGTAGEFTPGGFGMPFYSSLRLRIGFHPTLGKHIEKKAKIGESDRDIKKIIGIKSQVQVVKSSVDEPYRTADLYIVFNYGIDDIQANLLYCKQMTGATKFDCFDKQYVQTNRAIEYIEEKGYEDKLREQTIQIWKDVQQKLHIQRKKKVRS